MHFNEIWHLSIFSKPVEKIQCWLKYDKNKGYFTRTAIHIFDRISGTLPTIRNVSDKTVQKIKTHMLGWITFFFEYHAVYEIMWKNVVEPVRSRTPIWYKRIECWTPRLQTHTHNMCKTYCFPTAKMVTGTRLNVTLYVHCLSCLSTVSCLGNYLEAYVAKYCRHYAAIKQCFTNFSSIRAYIRQSQVFDLLRHVTTPNILLARLPLIVI